MICGNSEAPDWIIAEIALLAKLSSQKFESLTKLCAEFMAGQSTALDQQHLEQAGFSTSLSAPINILHPRDLLKSPSSDLQSMIACLLSILQNASSLQIPLSRFSKELQQIGLPKEHSDIFKDIQSQWIHKIRPRLISSISSCNQVVKIESQLDILIENDTFESKEPLLSFLFHCETSSASACSNPQNAEATISHFTFPLTLTLSEAKALQSDLTTVTRLLESTNSIVQPKT